MRFIKNTSGNVAVLFAFMLPVVIGCIGGAIDVGRWLHARGQTQSAIDAAVLSGARTLQIASNDEEQEALLKAASVYATNIKSRFKVINDTIKFSVKKINGAKVVDATGNGYIETPFLQLVRIDRLALFNESETPLARSEIAAGGKSKSNLEISLMLDVTGSMCSPCTKLTAMKDAAKDLINILISDDQFEYTSKAAIVPFSETVNLGDYYNGVMAGAPHSDYRKNVDQYNGDHRRWRKTSTCVAERTGPYKYMDIAPNGDNFPMPVYSPDGKCEPHTSKFLPLTDDKERLLRTVDRLSAAGGTAGHLGTAWAWYTLSPYWGSRFGGNSYPADYSQVESGDVRKIAVLMTDGDYNIQYCDSGVPDRLSNIRSDDKGRCSNANGLSEVQARHLCDSMKDKGIEIFSVGFRLDNYTARQTLSQCASDDTHYYDAKDEEQLRQSFRDIALKISDIYLSK